jgi:hypothetical protein
MCLQPLPRFPLHGAFLDFMIVPGSDYAIDKPALTVLGVVVAF